MDTPTTSATHTTQRLEHIPDSAEIRKMKADEDIGEESSRKEDHLWKIPAMQVCLPGLITAEVKS
jgi:hypothetical protein